MISFSVDGILLDIEGTTSSIDFVFGEMFPYVRRELDSFLRTNLDEPEVMEACLQIAREGELSHWPTLAAHPATRPEAVALIRTEILRMMDVDAKTTGLKQLQGLIWRRGFESGELRAHLFSEVADCLKEWQEAGFRLFIYSSGSVASQRLFFGHTSAGNLLGLFSDFFDTTTGPKRESTSYTKIAASCGLSPERILFVSDVAAELLAASQAGLQVALSLRPGNAPQPDAERYPQITSFGQLEIRH